MPRFVSSSRAMGEIRGLYTAMVTPFRGDGSVNDETGVALARHLLANGSHGLVVCGTTGEATTLSDEEHVEFVRLIASELGDEAPIFAGAGSNDTAHAAHLTAMRQGPEPQNSIAVGITQTRLQIKRPHLLEL